MTEGSGGAGNVGGAEMWVRRRGQIIVDEWGRGCDYLTDWVDAAGRCVSDLDKTQGMKGAASHPLLP